MRAITATPTLRIEDYTAEAGEDPTAINYRNRQRWNNVLTAYIAARPTLIDAKGGHAGPYFDTAMLRYVYGAVIGADRESTEWAIEGMGSAYEKITRPILKAMWSDYRVR